jgi:NADH-quinone oxidoreductase subunit D
MQATAPLHTEDNTFWINMGPQHPMTHGLWNMRVQVEGETIIDAVPEIGYLHRGVEKIAERRKWYQVTVLMDRLCYVSSLTWAHAYILAVEELMGVEIPERAKYLRVMALELQRIASHLMWLAAWLADLGVLTGFLYSLRDRELMLDLLQYQTGGRMNQNYPRPGGVAFDLPDGFTDHAPKVLDKFEKTLDYWEAFLDDNTIFLMRTQGLGVLRKRDAVNMGVTGPNLRGSGVAVDLRRHDPYEVYDDLDFEIATHPDGDTYARYKVRMEEMRQSVGIVRQCLDGLPDGAYYKRPPRRAEGEAFRRTEDARGEALIYVLGDGGDTPYRVKIRSPIFTTISAIPQMLIGHKVADVVSITGGVDMCVGEMDK